MFSGNAVDNIGDLVKLLRQKQKISRKKMAREVGINVETIRKVENGLHSPTYSTLIPLIRYLGYDIFIGPVIQTEKLEPVSHNKQTIRYDPGERITDL